MSVRQVSVDYRIAVAAANREFDMIVALGGSIREAVAAAYRMREEILSIARRSDDERL